MGYPEDGYAFGKTPLNVRICNFMWEFPNPTHIPIHPDEYYALQETERGQRQLEEWGKAWGIPILPLGVKP